MQHDFKREHHHPCSVEVGLATLHVGEELFGGYAVFCILRDLRCCNVSSVLQVPKGWRWWERAHFLRDYFGVSRATPTIC